MKRIAVMCLIASLTMSVSGVPAYARSVITTGNTVSTVEKTVATQDEEEQSAKTVSTDKYPDDWDADDPGNARAYMQQYGDEDNTEESAVDDNNIALFSLDNVNLARSSRGVTTTWENYTLDSNGSITGSKTNTYTHNPANTNGKSIVAGIDVSYHNGNIDWKKVKASGVDYAMIRVGYRGFSGGTIATRGDNKFKTYIEGAKAAGIKVGVYFFSQAINVQEAEEEAEWTLNHIKDYQIDLPVVIDYEYAGNTDKNGNSLERLNNANLSKVQKTENVTAFCNKVTAAGYQAMVYSSSSWLEHDLDTDALGQKYGVWMARFNTHSYTDSEKGKFYGGKIDIWQCSSRAKIGGISTCVDLDYLYEENNNNKTDIVEDSETGDWYYTVNGKRDETYTGVAKTSKGWIRIENGKANFDFYGIASNQNGTWYLKNGKVDFDYTGFTHVGEDWWYIEGGQVKYDRTDVIQGTVNGESGWWYVVGGKVTRDTTVAKNSNGWWRIENGKVNFNFQGIASNENGTWYLTGGKVDFGYNGFASDGADWWYVENGQITYNKEDVIKDAVNGETAWWHVVGSKVTKDTTVAKNSNGWWYIKDGKVDFGYNGFAENSNGWWYLDGGKVTFKKIDVIKGTVNGTDGWWHVIGSKVTFDTTVAKNGNGWWYIKDGMVDFTHSGVEKNSNGWWRVENGKVNFGFYGFAENSNGWWYLEGGKVTFRKNDVIKGNADGVYGWWHVVGSKLTKDTTVAKNSNGWWYIKDGLVDFTYNGIAHNQNGWWYLEGGKVNFGYNGTVTADEKNYTVKNGKVNK